MNPIVNVFTCSADFWFIRATIELELYVNIADWLLNNNLITVGLQHNGGALNSIVSDNTNDETVFTAEAPVGIEDVDIKKSNIYADYTVAYAPTIYYNLSTLDEVDVKVYNMNGQVVLADQDLSFEGNYFIRKELLSGSYIIVFSNDGLEESFNFIVQK